MAIIWTEQDLQDAKAAYMALMKGERVVSVGSNVGGAYRQMTFSNANKKDLKDLIDEIAQYLGQQAGIGRSRSGVLRTSKGI